MNSPLILTVTQLNSYAKSIIEQDFNLNNVFVVFAVAPLKLPWATTPVVQLDALVVKAYLKLLVFLKPVSIELTFNHKSK